MFVGKYTGLFLKYDRMFFRLMSCNKEWIRTVLQICWKKGRHKVFSREFLTSPCGCPWATGEKTAPLRAAAVSWHAPDVRLSCTFNSTTFHQLTREVEASASLCFMASMQKGSSPTPESISSSPSQTAVSWQVCAFSYLPDAGELPLLGDSSASLSRHFLV